MLKTAEAVSPMHPDKVCDRISDAILDACLEQDPESRVAIETMGGHGIVTITGELTTKAYIDMREIVRRIAGPGVGIQINVVQQSPEISQGVDDGGAGDQGIMVGYACTENPSQIPNELFLAKSLCKFLYDWNPQDGKTQVTLDGNGKIMTIVASWAKTHKLDLRNKIRDWLDDNEDAGSEIKKIYCNPAGDWNISGFEADTGLTGRKLAVDNYGPAIPIGGGAFSGKDGTKVDRSGAYMARFLALKALKMLYKPREPMEAMVKIAYAIGVAEPVMVTIQWKETNKTSWNSLPVESVIELEKLKPRNIIEFLNLKDPIYERAAEFGSFGDQYFTWENV